MWAGITSFFNSSFFIALVTGGTGGIAIWIYKRQQSENKLQLARLLLNEIRNAESAIQHLKDWSREDNFIIPEISVLPQNNWNKYSHIFSKDFDQDEIQLINKFYADAERVNYIVLNAQNMFLMNITHRSAAFQNISLRIIASSQSVEEAEKAGSEFNERFSKTNALIYTPKGYYENLKKYLPDINYVSPTTAGSKLKKLAKII